MAHYQCVRSVKQGGTFISLALFVATATLPVNQLPIFHEHMSKINQFHVWLALDKSLGKWANEDAVATFELGCLVRGTGRLTQITPLSIIFGDVIGGITQEKSAKV
ncbi:uncharacterized protein MELLADRAFT_113766 [Melampsora larici-populina 98AG31]|uniref:Uncharacterized protein n=1 Tax=Melampsora larici-populina (strain 98AG31 / pathotype 3-4-7) TaxID=747676 RepID=F4SB02_MELLP|nr:uncharacterized protein MELLADRAFT_113766 [Melampsora larici-populina 98AG31]EGF98150.1 hypothetical protein MELLADRAFT_113766 [Melampsora larici-populina 98AG31]